MTDRASMVRTLAAEGLGTALLLTAIVGSGIAAQRLTGDGVGLALLINAAATAAALLVLIPTLAPLSGAHFNPMVTLAEWLSGRLAGRQAVLYGLVQLGGAVAGVGLANAMFDLPVWTMATTARQGSGQWLAEAVAAFCLLAVVLAGQGQTAETLARRIAALVFAGMWFTSSTFLANPVVTIARALTDSFTGIQPADVPAFVLAQGVGSALALGAAWLQPRFFAVQAEGG